MTLFPTRWCRQIARRGLATALPRRVYLTHGPRWSGEVCLTFDDGPHPDVTPRILDILRDLKVPGTFFLIGREAEKYPEIVRRIVAEGHAIGSHSYSHLHRECLLYREAVEEVSRGAEAISRIIGRAPRFYRPPRGKMTIRDLWRLWRADVTTVLWNVDPKDCANGRSAADLHRWFCDRPLCSGDLVLFHDDQIKIVELLPDLVAAARTRKLVFTTVEAWTLSGRVSSGRQPTVPPLS